MGPGTLRVPEGTVSDTVPGRVGRLNSAGRSQVLRLRARLDVLFRSGGVNYNRPHWMVSFPGVPSNVYHFPSGAGRGVRYQLIAGRVGRNVTGATVGTRRRF